VTIALALFATLLLLIAAGLYCAAIESEERAREAQDLAAWIKHRQFEEAKRCPDSE
jgi:type II secretory pathway component PulJ